MKIEIKYPSAKLSSIVKCYWTLEKDAGQHIERLYPCGETQILFHYENPFTEITEGNILRQPQSIICGQMTTFKDIIAAESAGLFGIVFQPYSINTILHVASHELSQYSYDLIDINKIFQPLENQIREATDTEHRIKTIEDFLIRRIIIPNKLHFEIIKNSVNTLTTSVSGITVKKIAEKFSLSERQLERIFKDYVGLPPKSFAEIMRFKRAFYLMQKNTNLTQVSYSSGYYDQSHFIRTFKKFSGRTPGEYLRYIS